MTLPPMWVLKWAVGLLLVAAAFVAGHIGGVHAGTARVEQKWNAERARLFQRAAEAEQKARQVEQTRDAAIEEVIRHAEEVATLARADAARAAAAGAGLRQRAAVIAASCGRPAGDPGPTAAGSPASSAGDLLADVLGRLESVGRELAETADARGRAGAACESAFDAMR